MSRDTVEDYRHLDAHEQARARLADGMPTATIRWWHAYTGELTAAVTYRIELESESARLELTRIAPEWIEVGPAGNEVAHVPEWAVQVIALETSRPHFGGLRWWFACPWCNRRVARLYQARGGGSWLCRHDDCHGLSYRSRQESGRHERMIRRTERLIRRIDRRWPAPGPAAKIHRNPQQNVRRP
jgi:hypothetical protein